MEAQFSDLRSAAQEAAIERALLHVLGPEGSRKLSNGGARTREVAEAVADHLGVTHKLERAEIGRRLARMASKHPFARKSGETFQAQGRTFHRYEWKLQSAEEIALLRETLDSERAHVLAEIEGREGISDLI